MDKNYFDEQKYTVFNPSTDGLLSYVFYHKADKRNKKQKTCNVLHQS